MLDKLVEKITATNLDYKTTDFKTEVHFLGQIIGASEVLEDEGLSCEVFFEAGANWKLLSQISTFQTQTSYTNVLKTTYNRLEVSFLLLILSTCFILQATYSAGRN